MCLEIGNSKLSVFFQTIFRFEINLKTPKNLLQQYKLHLIRKWLKLFTDKKITLYIHRAYTFRSHALFVTHCIGKVYTWYLPLVVGVIRVRQRYNRSCVSTGPYQPWVAVIKRLIQGKTVIYTIAVKAGSWKSDLWSLSKCTRDSNKYNI